MDYQWSESLATGNEQIDEQHKQLFEAINNLMKACRQGQGGAELKKSIDFLNDYTIKHFFDEQVIQQKYKYPDYENHKNIHEGFKATVRDFSHKLILKGASEELANEVRTQIGDWLVNHIKTQDIRLGIFIKGK
ncbi:MAG: hemerythrin family protein [Spirochaetaceae bacterium]|jgi:hemerythrin|nr:hemerythrin family protein [Spirochaetaceae bacterium]